MIKAGRPTRLVATEGLVHHTWTRHSADEIVAKLKVALDLEAQGASVNEAAQKIGVARVTYYRWRMKFAGMNSEQVRCIRELEYENARLRKTIEDIEGAEKRANTDPPA